MDFGIDYWANILVPLDNFISRGTEHYLTCSQPSYQESVFQVGWEGGWQQSLTVKKRQRDPSVRRMRKC